MRGALLRASDDIVPKSHAMRNARTGLIRPLSKDLDLYTQIIEHAPDPLAAYRMISDGILSVLWYLNDVANEAADEQRLSHPPSPR